MERYKYLIVGGGMTADSAVKGIRELDKDGAIGLFSSDVHPPYDRPPLTKALWKGDPEDGIWRGTEQARMYLGTAIRSIDVQAKHVTDDTGASYGYEKLLLATGVSPRRLDFGAEGILYYRGFDDYKQLREMTRSGQRFFLVGGGFIGSELAAALTMNGKQAMIAFPGAGIGSNIFPGDLSLYLNGYYREKGVQVLSETSVTGCEAQEGKYLVTVEAGGEIRTVEVDGVIAGIGTVPNTELAQSAGLEMAKGIKVNSNLQTSVPDIYAAGDVALFHDSVLNEWRRVEHEDNANSMGTAAGRSMAGDTSGYTHSPFFYSDLFDLGYEAVGNVDSRLETFADWKDPFREGVVYYLKDGRVRGVLLWNVWEQVEAARALIAEPGPFTGDSLRGRIGG